jgi:hypothetical protein
MTSYGGSFYINVAAVNLSCSYSNFYNNTGSYGGVFYIKVYSDSFLYFNEIFADTYNIETKIHGDSYVLNLGSVLYLYSLANTSVDL